MINGAALATGVKETESTGLNPKLKRAGVVCVAGSTEVGWAGSAANENPVGFTAEAGETNFEIASNFDFAASSSCFLISSADKSGLIFSQHTQ